LLPAANCVPDHSKGEGNGGEGLLQRKRTKSHAANRNMGGEIQGGERDKVSRDRGTSSTTTYIETKNKREEFGGGGQAPKVTGGKKGGKRGTPYSGMQQLGGGNHRTKENERRGTDPYAIRRKTMVRTNISTKEKRNHGVPPPPPPNN